MTRVQDMTRITVEFEVEASRSELQQVFPNGLTSRFRSLFQGMRLHQLEARTWVTNVTIVPVTAESPELFGCPP